MNDFPCSAPVLEFPPCYSIEQMKVSEILMFGIFPTLTKFIREITASERMAGISDVNSVALVTKSDGGIERMYGTTVFPIERRS